ncbi:MAG: hypothetical protein AABZ61_04845, partial [Bacteroidota bacterium]
MAKYTAKTARKSYGIKPASDTKTIAVDGIEYPVDFAKVSRKLYSLLLDGHSYEFYMESDGESVRVVRDGLERLVCLRDERSRFINNLQHGIGGTRSTIEIKAPMPG